MQTFIESLFVYYETILRANLQDVVHVIAPLVRRTLVRILQTDTNSFDERMETVVVKNSVQFMRWYNTTLDEMLEFFQNISPELQCKLETLTLTLNAFTNMTVGMRYNYLQTLKRTHPDKISAINRYNTMQIYLDNDATYSGVNDIEYFTTEVFLNL
jgi:uncharacterized short protein YbdD (DUF466 family)